MAPEDVFHSIFELQLSLLQRYGFKLLGFGEIRFRGEFVQAIFQFVMLDGELVELLVRLQQQFLQGL